MAVFGIDLGTTNSLIGLDGANYLSEIVPSCVNMETGEAGASQYENMKARRSFKIDMSMGTEGILPRTASQHVLEELRAVAERDTGLEVNDVVISVPAYFSDSQRTATVTAAEMAGLKVRGLVNEPTAAAMYIAQDRKGIFVIFDLGGGTFDCSIIDSRFGTYDIQATDGICVGGDNLDKNLVKNFVRDGRVPFHHMNTEERTAFQHFASKMKIKMQKERKSFTIDLTPYGGIVYEFKPEVYNAIMKMTFCNTVEVMRQLIRKWIPSSEPYEILLVGGSTHCPFLREWIEECIGKKPEELTYDPDRVVAQGAALYASVVNDGTLAQKVSDVTPALSIGQADGTCSFIVPANSKIPLQEEQMFTNPVRADSLILKLYQGSHALAKDNECIGELKWDYGQVREAYDSNVLVKIAIDVNGMITFSASEGLSEEVIVTLNRNVSKGD